VGFGNFAFDSQCRNQLPLLAVQEEVKEWLASRGHGMTQSALLLL
jgi:hypothetical protein